MFIGIADYGLGRKIYQFQATYQIPETYAVIIVTGAFGIALNKLVGLAESALLHWMPDVQDGR